MATTTNYGWDTPDDTDLVKDGAAAIRTLGSSIDTTTKALNPSTTLGDIEYRSSTANTNTRLGIGTTGQVLTVSGGVPAWATPAGGTDTWTTVASSALSGLSTITISSLTYNKLILWVDGQTSASSFSDIRVRFNNSSTAADYDQAFLLGNQGATSNNFTSYKGALTAFDLTDSGNGGFWLNLFNGKSTSTKQVSFVGGSTTDSSSGTFIGYGNFNGTAAITELTVFRGSGTWTGGTLYVYGA
jgi:hypothetical protein